MTPTDEIRKRIHPTAAAFAFIQARFASLIIAAVVSACVLPEQGNDDQRWPSDNIAENGFADASDDEEGTHSESHSDETADDGESTSADESQSDETADDDESTSADESQSDETADDDESTSADESHSDETADDDESTSADESHSDETADDDESTSADESQSDETADDDDDDTSADESAGNATPGDDGPCPSYFGLNTVGAVFTRELVEENPYTGTQTTTVDAHTADGDGTIVLVTDELDSVAADFGATLSSTTTVTYRCDEDGIWLQRQAFTSTYDGSTTSGIREYDDYLVGMWNPTIGMTWSTEPTSYAVDDPDIEPVSFSVAYEVLSTGDYTVVQAGSFDDTVTMSINGSTVVYAGGVGALISAAAELTSADFP